MVVQASDAINWQSPKPLSIRVTWSDNHSQLWLNGALIHTFAGAATPMDDRFRFDPWLILDRNILDKNILIFRGFNDASAPSNPNPWKFDVALQDYLGGSWIDYKTYNAKSPGHPNTDQPVGLSYELTIEITAV